jgi:hypothetical protein
VHKSGVKIVRKTSLTYSFKKIQKLNVARLNKFGQSQSINKVPTRFDVYIKGNRNDIFATRGADIAILTGFGEHLFTKAHGFISNN